MTNMAKQFETVLISPVMSEKALKGENMGQYTFYVQLDATKVEVKQAVQKVYGILPVRVRVINTDGKKTRFGQFIGRRTATKKAIVTLPKGKTIAIHEGV
jgi:large subunit ribosomal protein L23